MAAIACVWSQAATADTALAERENRAARALTTTLYTPSYEVMANPERGFFHQPGDCDDEDNDYTFEQLQGYRAEAGRAVTLVRCIFYLRDKTQGEISDDQIEQFKQQARKARRAGVKLIVRFAYTDEDSNDAPPAVVWEHLHQLAEPLIANSDVILLVESGFVGKYGEGAYSRYFGDLLKNTETLPAHHAENRKKIVDRLLEILPSGRKVLVRTPRMKRMMFGESRTTAADVDLGNFKSRVGHLNDCFLDGEDDQGTFRDDEPLEPANARTYPRPNDRPYVARETRFVPMGGETCSEKNDSDRADCEGNGAETGNAFKELHRFHWSYLNLDWGAWLEDRWGPAEVPGSCLQRIQKRLGYRFRLVSTRSAPTVTRGGVLPFQMLVRNTGWAGTINRRPVFLVLRRTTPPHHRHRISLGTTADWRAHKKRLRACSLPIPGVLPVGRYRMYLSLPDPAPTLNKRSNKRFFSIRLANDGVWNENTGLNNLLRTVKVRAQAVALRPTARRDALPVCTNQAGPSPN